MKKAFSDCLLYSYSKAKNCIETKVCSPYGGWMCARPDTISRCKEVKKMDRNFRLRSARKRVTELLLSDSGAVDVRRTIGLGVAITGSMLAAILLTPHNASSVGNCPGAQTQCGADNNYACCGAPAPPKCCGPGSDSHYWCCAAGWKCCSDAAANWCCDPMKSCGAITGTCQ